MINRILIRIKVVQLLYSYLLTRSEFRILPEPEKNTRDSRFAYSLYIDLLLMIAKFTGQRISSTDETIVKGSSLNKLFAGEIGKALAGNNELRVVVAKNRLSLEKYNDILQYLSDTISDSAVCAEFSRKRKRDLDAEIAAWCVILETIIAKDKRFKDVCRNDEDFTLNGFQRAIYMVVETLRDYSDEKAAMTTAVKSLRESLDKAYDLYIALLMLPSEFTRLREEQLEIAKDKYLPTSDDLNPNLKFINNKFVKALRGCQELEKTFTAPILSQQEDYYLVKSLLDDILKSDLYREYMESTDNSLEADCEFWRNVLKDIVFNSDELASVLENKSIYWNDDLYIVGQFVLKTIRRTATDNNGVLELLPLFKNEDDEKFGEQLFRYAANNYKEYRKLIDEFINAEQWDSERLALMDIIILTAAIAEILNFPIIPVPVSLNEFIEIANYYSTNRSGQFINGILFSVINKLRAEGRLHKPF